MNKILSLIVKLVGFFRGFFQKQTKIVFNYWEYLFYRKQPSDYWKNRIAKSKHTDTKMRIAGKIESHNN